MRRVMEIERKWRQIGGKRGGKKGENEVEMGSRKERQNGGNDRVKMGFQVGGKIIGKKSQNVSQMGLEKRGQKEGKKG